MDTPDIPVSSSALPSSAAVPVAVPDVAEVHLQHRLISRWDDFRAALDSGHFYIEACIIAVALILSALVARIIVGKIRDRLVRKPPKFIDVEFLTKPLLMISPTLAIVTLWAVLPLVTGVGVGNGLTEIVTELAYAYWVTRCVFLAVEQRQVAYLISGAVMINAVLRAARVSHSTAAYLDSISVDLGRYHITTLHLVKGFFIFIVVFWGAGLLSQTLESYLRRSTRLSLNSRHLTIKIFKILFYVTAAFITLSAVGIDLTAFAIFSGAVGVGVGLGLQKLTTNFVSGFTVLLERSIRIGDMIEVGGNTGWVRALKVRYALIETSDGREILIPNEEMVSSRVVNWTLTSSQVSVDITVNVGFESDPVKAKALLLEAAVEHPRCLKDPHPSCCLKEFTDSGMIFTLTFWISDVKEGRNGARSDVMFAILAKFQQNQIVMAKG